MIIVCLRSHGCIGWIRGIIVLPANIHKAVKSSRSTRCAEKNSDFNPYFVTIGLALARRDLKPFCSKSMLTFSSKVIAEIMGIASCSACRISEVRTEDRAVVAMAAVTFMEAPVLSEMSPG